MNTLARTGRPPLEITKDYRITVRFDKNEVEMIDYICRVTNKTRNDAIRTAIERYEKYLIRKNK